MNKILFKIAAAVLVMLFSSLGGAWAGNLSSPWVEDFNAKTRLFVGGYDKEKKIIHLGWQLDLEDGWKTYWRSPGDAGLPPRWIWEGSENIGSITVRWPMPELLHIFGMDTYVYKHDVILPIDVAVRDAAEGVVIILDLDYMICEKICVPQTAKYRLDIAALDNIKISLFQKAQLDEFSHKIPLKISGENVLVTLGQNRMKITFPSDIMNVKHVYVEGPDGVLFGRTIIKNSHGVEVVYKGAELSEGQEVTLTLLLGDGRGLELNAVIQK